MKQKRRPVAVNRHPVLRELLMRRGRVTEIARAIGYTKQAVSQWSKIPREHAPTIAEALGLNLWDIRPDIWPEPMEQPGSTSSVSHDRTDA